MSDLLSLATGSDRDLVSYDDVVAKLQARQQIEKGTEMVPLVEYRGERGALSRTSRVIFCRVRGSTRNVGRGWMRL